MWLRRIKRCHLVFRNQNFLPEVVTKCLQQDFFRRPLKHGLVGTSQQPAPCCSPSSYSRAGQTPLPLSAAPPPFGPPGKRTVAALMRRGVHHLGFSYRSGWRGRSRARPEPDTAAPRQRRRFRVSCPRDSAPGRSSLTQAFKLLPGGPGVGISVVQGVGNEQHPLHLPGRREGRERLARRGRARAGSRSPSAALTRPGSSWCAAGSVPGTPLRAGWSWTPAAGAAGPPCRPGPPLPAPPGWGRAAAAAPTGPAMLDFAIFAVTFLLILVGAVLYLYPVMLPVAGEGGARPGPARRAGSKRPWGWVAPCGPGPSLPAAPALGRCRARCPGAGGTWPAPPGALVAQGVPGRRLRHTACSTCPAQSCLQRRCLHTLEFCTYTTAQGKIQV